ncbi:TlpA family protein disulfide reductase [Algoriphagus terrigena]|uniref:TlpA family protein disulfide reductase n=1 Tax=Algoriphagus terrigena TaxID=344884 RepID=UPI0012F72CD7|nr:TlpA disulfide reductase family protein [Algoriphagus terrigena]
MEKFLQTCFLALLCLAGSSSSAQSRVADSPTEAPLYPSALHVSPHSGDTHRGGETLPDTFLKYHYGPKEETAASLLGAPRSDVSPLPSLIDETASLRASARSDVSGHPAPSIPHPTTKGFSLVDDSTSQGQEGGIPSAQVGEKPLNLRIEIESPPGPKPQDLGITVSSQELDFRYDYILQVQDSLSLTPGEMLEGTMGLWEGELQIPMQDGFGRLQVSQDSRILIQDIWVQPQDSLRLSIDHSTGKVIFLGPQQDKFRLQLQLQDLAAAWIKSINPVMLTSGKERVLDSPQKVADYQKIAENHSFGWNRKMELLIQDSERLGRAEFLLNSAGQDHPVFQELKRYQDQLDPALYDWLWLYWRGKLRMQALDFMVLTRATSPEWGQLLLENPLEEAELDRIRSIKEFPLEFVESLYVENYLLELYSGVSFTHLTEALPVDLQNQVNAFFLVRQYKDLAAADQLISDLMEKLESPWIASYLQRILMANLQGREIINQPFWDEEGQPVYPESWKGKLVFLDFWLSGCGSCLAFARHKFLPLVEEFSQHPDILFVTITGDRDRELWKSTLATNQLTTVNTLDLYAGGVSHPALKQYHIQAFPEQLLLDKEGKILQTGGFPATLEGWRQLLQAYLNGENTALNSLTHSQPN